MREVGGKPMVMRGMEGVVMRCESCGHTETEVFREGCAGFRIRKLKRQGMKCPKCGGHMTVDPNTVVQF